MAPCSSGHRYLSTPFRRTSGQGCPVCSGRQLLTGFNDLATTHPRIAGEAYGWDPAKVHNGSEVKLSWLCKSDHIYEASVKSRTSKNSGCPFCAGQRALEGFNDLQTLFPEIAKEAKDVEAKRLLAGTHKKIQWECSLGHKWKATVSSRTSGGNGCPGCANSGFDPNEKGYLYFLEHPAWEMFQIGITNNPEKRVGEHIRRGWVPLEIRGPIDGHITREWETAILKMLRFMGADLANKEIVGKLDGYSESWSKSKFSTTSLAQLMQLTEEFKEN